MAKVRLLPSEARRRGLPAIGFDIVYGGEGITVQSSIQPVVTTISERQGDQLVGVLTIEAVPANLIIDRDGALAKALEERAPDSSPCALTLDGGASGYRADVVHARADLPYQSWFAFAPADVGGSGAVIVSLESSAPEWPAGVAMLATLRVFSRDADARAPSQSAEGVVLPRIKPSGS
jgi:hypothetical protein